MKLRMVKFLRIFDYNNLFFGDLIWVIECIGGMGIDGRILVIKNLFRMLNILYILGFFLELNLIVLWLIKLF